MVGEFHIPHHPWMHLVPAIEIDAVVIHEPFTFPCRSHAHGIVIKHHPMPASGDSPRAIIQPHCNPLVGKIAFITHL